MYIGSGILVCFIYLSKHWKLHQCQYYTAYCDGKFFKIPKRDFNFGTCEDGAGWHLIPCRISPRSEFFPQAYKNWHIMWGINLGLDWPPLARASKFHTIHTPTKATKLPPLDNGRYGPLGWDVIILIIVVGNLGFPCDILKE